MNYITTCTNCQTQFVVRDEHLESHQGKVKCGHCEHVFNAREQLIEVSDDIHTPAEYQASLERQQESNETPQIVETKDTEVISAASTVEEPLAIEESGPVAITEPAFLEDLTVQPQYQQAASKKSIGWGWVLMTLLLIGVAVIQSVYFMRVAIAANYPQFRPQLMQMCGYLKCQIPLPKVLEYLAIDDSDMQESNDHQGVLTFTSKLINRGYFVQAYPNVELTLTDAKDRPVLRRTLNPAEYLPKGANVEAGIAPSQEIFIELPISASDIAVAGYRVQVRY